MADPNEFDHVMPDLERGAPPPRPETIEENMVARLVYMLIIAIMINFAQTILWVVAVLQYVLTLVNGSKPNERLAEFGIDLGTWLAKAVRYQAMGSEEKPWPWTPWE